MTYLTDLADKVVESIDPYVSEHDSQPWEGAAVIMFTDGTKLSVSIDSRTFYYQGDEVRMSDFDKAFDHRIPTIYTPDPPPFRFPKDPVFLEIVKAFKTLRAGLDGYYGAHHNDPNGEFEKIVHPWKLAVQRYFGYRRGNNLTFSSGVFIQANERRPQWLLKLSNWLRIRTPETTSPK